jgi:hypothetical protein
MNPTVYLPLECSFCGMRQSVAASIGDRRGLTFVKVLCASCNARFTEKVLCSTAPDGSPAVKIMRTIRPRWMERLSRYRPVNSDLLEDRRMSEPPKLGEYLIYLFVSRQDRINMIGDLAEDFCTIQRKFGRSLALAWYYKQIIASIPPSAWKALFKWGTLATIGDWLRRHI